VGTDFRDLEVWHLAHRLTLDLYKVTSEFPKEERFELVSQIRRAAVSVELNIAEGQGRYHSLDSAKFFLDSRGSVYELQSALMIAKDLGFLTQDKFDDLDERLNVVGMKLNGLITYKRNAKEK